MFKALTPEIDGLARRFSKQILELESIFDRRTNIYLDYANLKNWSKRLGWEIDMKRLLQFLKCFDTIGDVNLYYGTISGDTVSEKRIQKLKECGYTVITKWVKMIKLNIDVSSLPNNSSTDILKNFISAPLLWQLKLEAIEYLNERLRELNKQGIRQLQQRKCNFDVEIGTAMQLDNLIGTTQGFSLWSGDSDFADPLSKLLQDGKKVTLFATARRVATELSELVRDGLFIYEIRKIREFIEK